MKKFTKKLIAFTMILCCLTVGADASVLGSRQIYGYTYEIGDNLYLYKNRFYSDQSDVGNQTENFFSYTPNPSTRPVVTLGKYVYGGEDINEIYEYLTSKGVRTLGGTNGDFFSVQTGIPSGHTIINKKIVSVDERVLPALGIREDGSVFISDFKIEIKMTAGENEVVIPCFNKYLQKWNYYMFDKDFYTSVKPEVQGKYVTMKIVEGEKELGSTLKAVVSAVENDIDKKEIGEDEIILALTNDSDPQLATVFEALLPETEVEFAFNSNDDELWSGAEYILASEAGQILKNGEYVGQELAGASPRTAVGITEAGEMILYTVDGRQKGHSFGVRIPTLANRMKELGCTDVLNLDGGGSTTISAVLGGTDEFSLQNIPSDGSLRNDSTYIFFENTSPETGKAEKLFLYPQTVYAKSGSEVNFRITASDSGYFAVNVPEDVQYEVSGNSYRDEEGIFHAVGEETAVVTASYGEAEATAFLKSIEKPDKLKVTNEKGEKITEIAIAEGEKIDLNIIAYYNDMEIISQDTSYLWEVSEKVGTITGEGVFTMGSESGEVVISYGDESLKIPVNAEFFSDISKNWARHYINTLYSEGVVNGFLENDEYIFKPGNYVTKNEMAVMLSKALKLDTKEAEGVELPFKDLDEIPDWALPYVKLMYKNEIIKGSLLDDGSVYFYPTAPVNRAEIFTIMGRILKAEGNSEAPFSDREEFPTWATPYIDALYEKGMVNGYDDNMLKVFNNITRAEISKIIVKALY